MMHLIAVTQDDITKHKRMSCHHCAVALATYRAMGLDPASERVTVGAKYIHLDLGEDFKRYRYALLPEVACDFIGQIGRQESVNPIAFSITFQPSILESRIA